MTTVDRSRVSWMLPKPGTSERSTHTGRAGSPAVSASTVRWLVAVSASLDIACRTRKRVIAGNRRLGRNSGHSTRRYLLIFIIEVNAWTEREEQRAQLTSTRIPPHALTLYIFASTDVTCGSRVYGVSLYIDLAYGPTGFIYTRGGELHIYCRGAFGGPSQLALPPTWRSHPFSDHHPNLPYPNIYLCPVRQTRRSSCRCWAHRQRACWSNACR